MVIAHSLYFTLLISMGAAFGGYLPGVLVRCRKGTGSGYFCDLPHRFVPNDTAV